MRRHCIIVVILYEPNTTMHGVPQHHSMSPQWPITSQGVSMLMELSLWSCDFPQPRPGCCFLGGFLGPWLLSDGVYKIRSKWLQSAGLNAMDTRRFCGVQHQIKVSSSQPHCLDKSAAPYFFGSSALFLVPEPECLARLSHLHRGEGKKWGQNLALISPGS